MPKAHETGKVMSPMPAPSPAPGPPAYPTQVPFPLSLGCHAEVRWLFLDPLVVLCHRGSLCCPHRDLSFETSSFPSKLVNAREEVSCILANIPLVGRYVRGL